jgi:hypothetical protein
MPPAQPVITFCVTELCDAFDPPPNAPAAEAILAIAICSGLLDTVSPLDWLWID